jgi:hypothetical protein
LSEFHRSKARVCRGNAVLAGTQIAELVRAVAVRHRGIWRKQPLGRGQQHARMADWKPVRADDVAANRAAAGRVRPSRRGEHAGEDRSGIAGEVDPVDGLTGVHWNTLREQVAGCAREVGAREPQRVRRGRAQRVADHHAWTGEADDKFRRRQIE